MRAAVAGLGNAGAEAARHSVGMLVVRRLAARRGGLAWTGAREVKAELAQDADVVLARPKVLMNESGKCAKALLRRFPGAALLVVCDDLDMALGRVRFKEGGSARGHNGVRSVAQALGTDAFGRILVGIGRPAGRGNAVRSFVLEHWTAKERERLEAPGGAIDLACDAIEARIASLRGHA